MTSGINLLDLILSLKVDFWNGNAALGKALTLHTSNPICQLLCLGVIPKHSRMWPHRTKQNETKQVSIGIC